MHQLFLAETTFDRLAANGDLVSGIEYVTINQDAELKRDGALTTESDLKVNMLRLDFELFMTGQIDTINRIIENSAAFEFVQTSAAGLDNPIFKQIASKSRVFCNSDAQSPSIAEFVVASVLNRWHRFDLRRDRQQAHEWQGNAFRQILGSRWLIVGFGHIGQWVAQQVKGFGGEVVGVKRILTPQPHADLLVSLDDCADQLPLCDVVLLSCPLNDSTRGLADAAFFRHMKPDAVFVNIGRGDLVDEQALINALDAGELDYAILDVFKTEPLPGASVFWDHERVQVTPHASHQGAQTDVRFESLFRHNLAQVLAGGAVLNQVSDQMLQ